MLMDQLMEELEAGFRSGEERGWYTLEEIAQDMDDYADKLYREDLHEN